MEQVKKFYKDYQSFINPGLIIILGLFLLKVAYFDPLHLTQLEESNKKEARNRLHNLRTAQRAYVEKYGHFSGNIDELINFVKTAEAGIVLGNIKGLDSSLFSFRTDEEGVLRADSLKYSTKVHQPFTILLDSVKVIDSVFSEKGKFIRVDTSITRGTRFKIVDPSGYGSIGNLYFDALKYSASWE